MRRKIWLVSLSLVLLTTMTVFGVEDRQMNIWLTFGGATSEFDNALVDVGFDLQLTRGLYFQFVANTHMGNDRYSGYPYYNNYPVGYYNTNSSYYGGRWFNIGFSTGGVHGLSAYSMFKIPLSKRISFFTKAGIHMAFYDEYQYIYDSSSYHEDSTSGLGLAAGGGLSYALTEKVGLLGGVTYKYLFNGDSSNSENDDIDWFKIYVGISYRIK